MSIRGLDHVAIAVESLEESVNSYERTLDVAPHYETVEEQSVKIAAFEINGSRIELLEPLDDDSPVGKFLEKNGEGIHHFALKTDSVDSDLKRISESEIQCIDSDSRPGAQDYRIAFLHPSNFNGTLLELAEPPEKKD